MHDFGVDTDKLLKPKEAAERMGVAPRTLARWAEQGRVTSISLVNGHRRYRPDDIAAAMKVVRAESTGGAT